MGDAVAASDPDCQLVGFLGLGRVVDEIGAACPHGFESQPAPDKAVRTFEPILDEMRGEARLYAFELIIACAEASGGGADADAKRIAGLRHRAQSR